MQSCISAGDLYVSILVFFYYIHILNFCIFSEKLSILSYVINIFSPLQLPLFNLRIHFSCYISYISLSIFKTADIPELSAYFLSDNPTIPRLKFEMLFQGHLQIETSDIIFDVAKIVIFYANLVAKNHRLYWTLFANGRIWRGNFYCIWCCTAIFK